MDGPFRGLDELELVRGIAWRDAGHWGDELTSLHAVTLVP